MTKIEKRIIALFGIANRSIAQETELKNLMRNGATASAQKVKATKEKRSLQLEKANKKVAAIIRECAKEIQAIYVNNDICLDKRNLNFSYSAKATSKPSAKNAKCTTPLIAKRKKVASKSKDFNERATLIAKDIKKLTTSA
jgi:hypothetical protein